MPLLTQLSKDYQKSTKIDSSETQHSSKQEISDAGSIDFDDQTLMQLHRMHGNKWKKISSYFPNKDDSFIKNYFYSLLRRSLRKLNAYIRSRSKDYCQHKLMKLNFVFKLTNLAQSQRNGICNKNIYQNLLYQFLRLKDQKVVQKNIHKEIKDLIEEDQYFDGYNNFFVEKLLNELREIEMFFLEHNLNKKGKSKKKCPKKLELKKDIIRRSLSDKQKHSFQTDEELRDFEILSQLPVTWSTMQEWQKMLDFNQNEGKEVFKSILNDEATFDPTLFK